MKKITSCMIGIIGGFFGGSVIGSKWVGKQYDIHCEKVEKNADKFSDYYVTMLQWVKLHQQGKTLHDYFEKKGYKRIAIYGMNDIAHVIIAELKDTSTSVEYCIDRNADNLFLEMKVYRPDEVLPDTDICVIALPDLFEEILNTLKDKLNCPIVSIEDIVWGI